MCSCNDDDDDEEDEDGDVYCLAYRKPSTSLAFLR